MNVLLLIAAATLFFIGTMHSVLAEWSGDRRLVRRLVQSTLFAADVADDLLARQIVRLAWHLTSLAWFGIAAVLAYLSFVEEETPQGTRVVHRESFVFHPPMGRLVERFLRAWIARDVREEVFRMKHILERDRGSVSESR